MPGHTGPAHLVHVMDGLDRMASRAGCCMSALCMAASVLLAHCARVPYGCAARQLQRLSGCCRQTGWDIDCVVPVPDGSRPAAIQMSAELGLPYREGLVKNRYVGRTFIMPDQRCRPAPGVAALPGAAGPQGPACLQARLGPLLHADMQLWEPDGPSRAHRPRSAAQPQVRGQVLTRRLGPTGRGS